MLETQKVLDHGYVKFIESMGTEETIIEAARMSVGRGFISWDPYTRCTRCDRLVATTIGSGIHAQQHGPECDDTAPKDSKHLAASPRGDQGLLEYLYKNGHTTPFEMCQLHVEINAPIFVWRQFHRHRVFSYNEQSGRYGILPDTFYVPDKERIKMAFAASKNKQAKGAGVEIDDSTINDIQQSMRTTQQDARDEYEWLLKLGMAPELARNNCPVSQYSKCRVSGDLHNLLHSLLRLRMHSHAQWEIREYANAVASMVKEIWPRTYALFAEHVLGGVKLSRSEREVLYSHLNQTIGGVAQDSPLGMVLKKLGASF
jgi:thymidylate synthase (FAD)